MRRVRWQERAVIEPDLHADGMTPEEIQEQYPQSSTEDIRAALAYAADAMHQDVLVPLSLPVSHLER